MILLSCRMRSDKSSMDSEWQDSGDISENTAASSSSYPSPTSAEETRRKYDIDRGKSRVYLYEQIVPWRELKSELHFDADKLLAKFLISTYLSGQHIAIKCDAGTQTDNPNVSHTSWPALFSAESPIKPMEPLMMSTPVRDILDKDITEETPQPSRKRRLLSESTITASTMSRLDSQDDEETLTILHSPELELEAQDQSPDDINVRGQSAIMNVDGLNKTFPDEEVFDLPLGDELEMEDPELAMAGEFPQPTIEIPPPTTDIPPPTTEIPPPTTPIPPPDIEIPQPTSTTPILAPLHLVQMEKCIVFTDRILELLQGMHGADCNKSGCCKKLEYKKTYVGSCLVVTWKCSSGHAGGSWSSQPLVQRMRAGNLLLSSCLLLSGNSFTKISLFFKFLNLKFISKTLFYQHQGLYVAPVVETYWDTMRQNLIDERKDKEILLSSDARNDSPGHCAQYCTYTITDMVDQVILQQNILDVREVEGRKSTNMERLGFEKGMDALLSTDLVIKEVITDGHTGIAALMSHSEKYLGIVHQRDVWHGGKSIGKKVTNAAKEKGNEDLMQWAGAVKNHFWYCSRHCEGNVDDLKDLWRGMLQHVVNEHEWVLDDGKSLGKCGHDPLNDEERQKPWLKKNSKAHKALQKIVLSKRFLNTFPYYTNFRHAGFLESFHNHLLMYCPKRHSYSYVGYKLRNQLAVIDFNSHGKRQPYKDSDGKLVHRAQYSKRTKQWRAVTVLQPKEYTYIPSLIVKIFEQQMKMGSVNKKIVRSDEDPRNIAPNIALVPRPSIQHLLQTHKSRF